MVVELFGPQKEHKHIVPTFAVLPLDFLIFLVFL